MHHVELSLPAPSLAVQELIGKANGFIEAAKASATRKAYAADLRDYRDFCFANQLPFLAPDGNEALALYVTDLAGRVKPATISRRIASLATAYHTAGHRKTPASSFLVTEVLRGVKRTLGVAQERKRPLMPADLERMISACPVGLLGMRDRSLLLLGFASSCRRAELCALEVRDLAFTDRGLVLTVRRGKADQQQRGREVPVAFATQHPEMCPVRALTAWLEALAASSLSGLVEGPLFRAVDRHGNPSSQPLEPGSVSRILKTAARRAGMSEVWSIGAHSLRAGMATTAAIHGAGEREIALVTGHRSREVRRYIRDADLFRAGAAEKLGL